MIPIPCAVCRVHAGKRLSFAGASKVVMDTYCPVSQAGHAGGAIPAVLRLTRFFTKAAAHSPASRCTRIGHGPSPAWSFSTRSHWYFASVRAADAPIRIAQMIVHRRIVGHQFHRMFELLDRALEITREIERPADGIDDMRIVRSLRRQWPVSQIFARLRQILAHRQPAIGEVVQHIRLVGRKFQRAVEIGFRLVPFAIALIADATCIKAAANRLPPAVRCGASIASV